MSRRNKGSCPTLFSQLFCAMFFICCSYLNLKLYYWVISRVDSPRPYLELKKLNYLESRRFVLLSASDKDSRVSSQNNTEPKPWINSQDDPVRRGKKNSAFGSFLERTISTFESEGRIHHRNVQHNFSLDWYDPTKKAKIQRFQSIARSSSNQTKPKFGNCNDGIFTDSRKHFWSYYDQFHPQLYDAVHKAESLFFILLVRTEVCSMCFNASWTSWSQRCIFSNDVIVDGSLIVDPKGNVVLVECRLNTLPASDSSQPETVTLEITRNDENPHHYRDVPFCRYPSPAAWNRARLARNGSSTAVEARASSGDQRPIAIAACTMVRTDLHRYNLNNSERLLEWIAYHRLQGVGHFLVYANEDPAPLRRLLAPYVAEGLVDVVDWEMPQPGFVHQVPQTTSCIYRYRGLARWVGLMDVDEFMQPLAPGATLLSTLDAAAAAAAASAGRDDVAALKVASVYFYRSRRNHSNSTLQTVRYQLRERGARPIIGKCFVRPERVRTFMVHRVTAGQRTVLLDPEKTLRMVHYRDQIRSPVVDTSMAGLGPALQNEVARVRAASLAMAANAERDPFASGADDTWS